MCNRRRRQIGFWALGLAAVLSGPTLAQAQLFQDLPIRRQRPCCVQEDPRYHMVREVYFGYYPTCWRKFPEGWGCYPKEGMPDWQAALQERPLDEMDENPYGAADNAAGRSSRRTLPTQAGPIPGAGDVAPPNPNTGMPPLPPESGNGSLFDQENLLRPPGGVTNPPPAAPGTAPAPGANPTLPTGNDDLFNPGPLNPGATGTTPPEARLTPMPSEQPASALPSAETDLPLVEAPAPGAIEPASTFPEVQLEGELPQAPPLGAPAAIANPASGNLAPPMPANRPAQAPATSSAPAPASRASWRTFSVGPASAETHSQPMTSIPRVLRV